MSILVVGSIGYDTIETQNGKVSDALGGSAAYFALAARFFSPVSLVAAVGTDFRAAEHELLRERGVDLRGLESIPGPTFRWHGRYHEDMNRRDTLDLQLGVFAEFSPKLTPEQQRADYLFLANISPELQSRVLEQMTNPKVVAADTMNHWIENARPALLKLLSRIQILTLNDEEARQLSGEHNLVKAGRAIMRLGPTTLLVKRGEYGVLQFSPEGMFAVPAYPLEEVYDPTGAGDTFAGGFMGYLARVGRLDEAACRKAVVYGSVLASFVVERFSVERIAELSWSEVENRYRAFLELTDSNHPRWT